MIEYSCNSCKKQFNVKVNKQINTNKQLDIDTYNNREFDADKHFYYCSNCIKNYKLYSASSIMQKFYLKKEMFAHLKILYIPHKNNSQKFYLQEDIINIINTKFKDIDSYLEMVNHKKKIKMENKKMVIENRRKELEQAFYDNKLEFRYLGDCYAYVNYGKPSIENILTNEFNKLEEQGQRRSLLAEMLNHHNIILDNNIEKNPIVDNYIKYSQGNMRNIINIIKNDHHKKNKLKIVSQTSTKIHKPIMISFD